MRTRVFVAILVAAPVCILALTSGPVSIIDHTGTGGTTAASVSGERDHDPGVVRIRPGHRWSTAGLHTPLLAIVAASVAIGCAASPVASRTACQQVVVPIGRRMRTGRAPPTVVPSTR
jgi:hypothetical protein